MTKQDTLPPLEQERAAFEAWIAKDCGDLSTFGTGANTHYRNSAVNNSWIGWKTRAALAAQAPQQALGVPEAILTAASLAAMAAYPKGHLWDELDAAVCKRAADMLAAAPQQAHGVASAYRVKTKGGRSWVIDGAPSASDLAEIENLGDSVELLAAAPQAAPAPAPQSLPISALEEQQMFDDWCPYKGSPDPRVVWAAAIDAANGLLSGLTERKAPAPQALTELTDEQIAAAVRPLYRSDQAAKLGLDDDIRTVRAVFGIGAASAGGE